jgi:hypothetical protein
MNSTKDRWLTQVLRKCNRSCFTSGTLDSVASLLAATFYNGKCVLFVFHFTHDDGTFTHTGAVV